MVLRGELGHLSDSFSWAPKIRRSSGTHSFGMGSDQCVPGTDTFVLSHTFIVLFAGKSQRGNSLKNQLQSS